MSSPSNLYAEKIYAEQPTTLWALDEDVNFVSLLSSSALDFQNWTVSGGIIDVADPGTDVNVTAALSEQISDTIDPYAQIAGASFVKLTTNGNTSLTSQGTISASGQFSAGVWVNPQSEITSIVFTINTATPITHTFDMSGVRDEWVYLGHIFELASAVSSKTFTIDVKYTPTLDENNEYPPIEIYFNGFSVGKDQSNFGSSSTGSQLVSTGISSFYGTKTYEYGIAEKYGWYIGNNTTKTLYASGSSVPMVYGSKSSTRIVPNSSGPSLIIPGSGFFNQSKQNQVMTFEVWLRINSDGDYADQPTKIFGPLESSDGLYVNGQHLILKMGTAFVSHYVGEWYRPILVDIEYVSNYTTLLVNGEAVAKIDTDTSMFPDQDNDYLAFYCGGNISSIDIDCIAIYPYRTAPVLALRRYGYGQAVSLPSEIETAYSGKQIQVDYTFAGYSADYSYPKIESWKSSTKENLYSDSNVIGSPHMSAPDIALSDTHGKNSLDSSIWKDDLYAIQDLADDPFIKMRPSTTFSSANGYLYFRTLRTKDVMNPSSIYVVCKADPSTDAKATEQVVFRLQDKDTLDSIFAILSGTTLSYQYNIGGVVGTIGSVTVSSGAEFVAGLSFDAILGLGNGSVNLYMKNKNLTLVKRFLRGKNNLSVFIGGDYSGSQTDISTTFLGKIYKLGFSSLTNRQKNFSGMFSSSTGIAVGTPDDFKAARSSYEYSMKRYKFEDDYIYSLDTSAESYWQDILPISKFQKYTYASDGTQIYTADMIQFSIDAAASKDITSGHIDTSKNSVKAYVYFKYSTNPIYTNFAISGFTKVNLDDSFVVDARSDWSAKLYEVADESIIMLPNTGFSSGKSQEDLVMVTVLHIDTESYENMPIRIRSIEYASQTFDRRTDSFLNTDYSKKIGTRSQTSSMQMYSKSGSTYSFSTYNPVRVTKNMAPYLYLTNKSGVKVLDYSPSQERGVFISINKNAADLYKVSLVSMYMLIEEASILNDTMTVFEISDDQYTKIRLLITKTNDSKVGKMSLQEYKNSVWTNSTDVEFYINGRFSAAPIIRAGQWVSVSMLFPFRPLDFSLSSNHGISIQGSAVVNNISYYQLRQEELAQQVIPNEWNDYDSGDHAWSAYDTEKTWSDLAAQQAFVRPELSPVTVSNIYNGTNRIIATADEDYSGISLSGYRYDIVEDVIRQNTVNIVP